MAEFSTLFGLSCSVFLFLFGHAYMYTAQCTYTNIYSAMRPLCIVLYCLLSLLTFVHSARTIFLFISIFLFFPLGFSFALRFFLEFGCTWQNIVHICTMYTVYSANVFFFMFRMVVSASLVASLQ